jgi:hypothetical protein
VTPKRHTIVTRRASHKTAVTSVVPGTPSTSPRKRKQAVSHTVLLQPDVADILAGALQCSKGTAYELMQEALNKRDREQERESIEAFKEGQRMRQAFFDSNNWNRKR